MRFHEAVMLPVLPDPTRLFRVGHVTVSRDAVDVGLEGGGGNPFGGRFHQLVERHERGLGGTISFFDKVLNEFVVHAFRTRGIGHIVVSEHEIEGVGLRAVTHLGERRTRISLAISPTLPSQAQDRDHG